MLEENTKLYNGSTELSSNDKEIFFHNLRKLRNSKKIYYIYRGQDNLKEQYNTDCSNIDLLCHYIFVLGEKGKHFIEERTKSYENVFEFLWNKLHNKVCNLKFEADGSLKAVESFLTNNPQIKSYFSDINNEHNFLELANLPINDSVKIKDYYFTLLHTIGKSALPNSYFLSSTLDEYQTKRFTNGSGILLFGWIPKKGYKDNIIKYEDVCRRNDFIYTMNLPTYDIPVYEEQKEICLKCGLLPHYTIGFKHDKNFYVNPNFLVEWNDNIPCEGVSVKQDDFNILFEKSKYHRSFLYCDGVYCVIDKKDSDIL